MPNRKSIDQRVRAAFRTRACAAGLCAGTQLFLAGCATAMPLALSSAWLAALAVLPLVCFLTLRSRRILMQPPHAAHSRRIRGFLLFFTLLASAAFALASVSVFAAQTLAQESRALLIHAAALCAAALCALSGGTGAARLCFALRWLLPTLVLGLSLSAVPLRVPVGLFPILGAGAAPLGAAALATLFGAAPVLILALPPPELHAIEPENMVIPDARFFLSRVLGGAACGILLLFFTSACTTYESIAESGEWGARLRMAAGNQPHEGIFQMLLVLAKLLSMLLLSVHMLCGAQQALHLAVPGIHSTACLIICVVLLGVILLALLALGDMPLLFGAPLIAVPAILAAALPQRRKRT